MIEVAGSENEEPMKQRPTGDAVGARTEPVGPWLWVTDGLIEETIRVWEPRYGREIGPEEAALILTRAVELVRVLAEHSQHVDAGDPGGEPASAEQAHADLKRPTLPSWQPRGERENGGERLCGRTARGGTD
jgi:hypothetical protein